MSDQLRFLVTVDANSGSPVKAERVGESGDLTEVDLRSLLAILVPGQAVQGVPQQIVVNVYAGGGQGDLGVRASRMSFSEEFPRPNMGVVAPWPPPIVSARED